MKHHRRGDLAVLENLLVTGALEIWLLKAQHDGVLATLASGIRHDREPHKAERWLADAIRSASPPPSSG